MIQDTLLHFDGERYRLLAWVVMPNHFHVVLDQMNGWTVCKIVASWKKFTASQIRKIHPGFPKPVWHREYWDRYIRDGEHLGNSIRYDEENPVKAGLCSKATEWQWSSARKRG